MAAGGEILVLGPENSGKSLLLRRMSEYLTLERDEYINSTVPTVGMDVKRVDIGGIEVALREVGSAMNSGWNVYVKGCSCLMYVVDISDSGSVAGSVVLLMELLTLPEIVGKLVVIVFNKEDLADQNDFDRFYGLMDIDSLIKSFQGRLQFFSGAAVSQTVRGDPSTDICPNALASEIMEWVKTEYVSSVTGKLMILQHDTADQQT